MRRAIPAFSISIVLLVAGNTALPAQSTNAASSNAFIFEFEAKCATCHGDNSSVDRAPNRDSLESMAPERIYQSLTDGPMAQFVPDWSDDEKKGLATALSGRPFGGAETRSAASMSNQCTDVASNSSSPA